MTDIEQQNEQRTINIRYEELTVACRKLLGTLNKKDEDDIFRAFTIARDAHNGVRRKSGEPYILHPLSVALIAVKEVGLGPKAVISALLHDVVEDTDITLDQIEATFGKRVANIVDGVTKVTRASRISATPPTADLPSLQAENYRKILLAMCSDVYVIFIKLCDRLHNMRTLASMPPEKQLYISSETQYLYIPLAHRLGLYSIKTELEELVMRYTNPVEYAGIQRRISKAKLLAPKLKETFVEPIRQMLDAEGYKYTLMTRVKSTYSCYKKMQNKGVDFNEIYDLFAMRIILDVPQDKEKEECFRIYATISKHFPPNPARFRDWITAPKVNGYESLHTTVMSPIGRWVEVQIRSRRMDEIAEKGMAAHFLYKEAHPEAQMAEETAIHGQAGSTPEDGNTTQNTIENAYVHSSFPETQTNPVEAWLQQIRTTLENTDKSALDLVEEFKETLYTREIFVFTPKGQTIKLPAHATVLDFAYAIHSHLGNSCIGAKINAQVKPITQELHSGDQVQIITSRSTHPSEDWLGHVVTPRARDYIKVNLRDQKRPHLPSGQQRFARMLQNLGRANTASTRGQCLRYFLLRSNLDLFYRVDIGEITQEDLAQCLGLAKRPPKLIFLEPYRHLFTDEQPLTGDNVADSALGNAERQESTAEKTGYPAEDDNSSDKDGRTAASSRRSQDNTPREGEAYIPPIVTESHPAAHPDAIDNQNPCECGTRPDTPFLLEKDYDRIEASPAPCCKPVQGDDVVGLLEEGKIIVHRSSCPVAMHEMSIHKDQIVRTRWRPGEKVSFLTGVALTAFDRQGILQEITRVISQEMNLNMRAITIESSEGLAHGVIMLYVHDLNTVNRLIGNLRTITGIEKVQRI